MVEITANIHMHTPYSDGSKYHAGIAYDAIKSGIDVICFTDHNIFLEGVEGIVKVKNKKVITIMGEEIHDQNAKPQKNHLLVLGADQSYSHLANNRQRLIDKINSISGVTFLAHPYDPALPAFDEADISWEDWTVNGFTGIELWNGFSELKVRVKTKAAAYFYAFFPKFLPLSPPEETMKIWDRLLNNGMKIVAVGGSDAHAIHFRAGFLKRVVFPYQYHFSTLNNHILLENKLTGNFNQDKLSILQAIKKGKLYIANDLIHSPYGFRFFVKGENSQADMGETFSSKKKSGVSGSVILPMKADCHIIKNGKLFHQISGKKEVTVKIDSPGVYRVEVYKYFLGRKRGWIFSNPIFVE